MIKYLTRRNGTKYWNKEEDEYITNSSNCLLVMSIRLGRSSNSIRYRLKSIANKTNVYPTKRTGLRIKRKYNEK